MSERPLIAGLGRVELQFIGVMPRFPESAIPTEVESISIQIGGTGAVAIGTTVNLGCHGRFACKLTEEFLGTFILGALRSAGIETRGVLAADRQLSGLRFTAMAKKPNRRLSFYSRGDVGELEEGDLDFNRLLDGADALLVDGYAPRSQVRLAEAAHERGIPVIFDGSEFGDQVGELVALSDVLICSERLGTELARTDDLERMLVELRQLGPGAVVVTLGDAGSIGLHGEQLVRQPAYPTKVIDPDGAGAVFHGAFATALLNDLPFARCMEFASTAAGLSCQSVGAWAGIPTRTEVVEAMKRNS